MDLYQRWLLYAVLFGIIVVVIWVAQWLHHRKSEKRRIVIKTGPKIERFVDPGKAVKPDTIYTKAESQVKARHWWEQSGLSEGICGVCNGPVKSPEGYMVPLKMVVESTAYLDIAAKPIMEFGVSRDKAFIQLKEEILSEKAPWLVCDKCSSLFFSR